MFSLFQVPSAAFWDSIGKLSKKITNFVSPLHAHVPIMLARVANQNTVFVPYCQQALPAI